MVRKNRCDESRAASVEPAANIGLDLTNTALRAVSFGHCACFSVFAAQPTVQRTDCGRYRCRVAISVQMVHIMRDMP